MRKLIDLPPEPTRQCARCGYVGPRPYFRVLNSSAGRVVWCKMCHTQSGSPVYIKGPSPLQKAQYKRLKNGLWLCSKCKTHKSEKEYYNARTITGAPPSHCADCSRLYSKQHRENNIEKFRVPKEEKNKRASERREALLSEPLTCERCGETKPRSEWPVQRGTQVGGYPGRPRKYCCSRSKRTEAEVQEDKRLGSKVCSSCDERKPFDCFSPNIRAEDGRQTTCKQCRRAKVGSGEWVGGRTGRKEVIAARSDGSLTTQVVANMFAKAKSCPCCTGTMSRNDKVMDHIVPLKLGGEHSVQNTMVLCKWCNSTKAAKHPSVWLDMLNDDAAARMRAIYKEKGLDFG